MSSHIRPGLLLAVVAVLSSCGPASTTPSAHATSSPTPKPFDFSAWTVSTTGTGPAVAGNGSGLDLVIPATAQGDPNQHLLLEVVLQARCQLTGDFDVQADYSLITWTPQNGVHFGLVAGGNSAERASNPHGSDNLYESDFSGQITGTDTADTAGRLRLSRVGTTMTSYYLREQTWVPIATTTGPATPLSYKVGAWTDGYSFGTHDVRVNLKNLSATGCA
jgi:hypothetical protein